MIWIETANGVKCRITVRSGLRTMLTRTGLRTAMATGFGNRIMDGPGLETNNGAGRRITMGAGSVMAARGDGGRVNAVSVPFGRRRMSPSLVSTVISESMPDLVLSDGCLSDRVIRSSRGGADSVS